MIFVLCLLLFLGASSAAAAGTGTGTLYALAFSPARSGYVLATVDARGEITAVSEQGSPLPFSPRTRGSHTWAMVGVRCEDAIWGRV